MADDYLERDFDDEVYEDDYYEENYDEEELEDSEDDFVDDKDTDDNYEEDEENSERKIHMSYACEECDYRWDDVIYKRKDDIDDSEMDAICPMCGSMNVTQI